jgi:hypothetical protein
LVVPPNAGIPTRATGAASTVRPGVIAGVSPVANPVVLASEIVVVAAGRHLEARHEATSNFTSRYLGAPGR